MSRVTCLIALILVHGAGAGLARLIDREGRSTFLAIVGVRLDL